MDKKELKNYYKQNPQPMGIYMIKNNSNGKIFVGSSLNLKGKENSFRFQLKAGTHMNTNLQNDYNLFGDEKFSYKILDTLDPKDDPNFNYREELKVFEEMWIEKLSPFDEIGYNKRK